MKVVHIITDLDVGGAEVMLARLLETLDRGRVQSAVISLGTTGAVGERIQRAGIPVFALGLRPDRVSPLVLWRLVRLIKQLHPDVVQTWLYHADLAGILGGTVARVPRIVWNIRCATLDPSDHPYSLSALLRVLAFASRWTSAVICNSAAGQRAHEALGYRPSRWLMVPNGFDTATFCPCPPARADLRQVLGLREDAKVVGLLARWHPMKDHATFLRSAKVIARARPDVRWVMAGRGVEQNKSLVDLIEELQLTTMMHLLPEQTDVPHFLAGLDVAVSCSYSEAFPNVVGEAMACGIPCVVTDVGESAHIVGDTGIVVPPRDPQALADGILRLLALDAASRDAIGRAARSRIVAEFSIDRAAANYEGFYRELTCAGTLGADTTTCAG